MAKISKLARGLGWFSVGIGALEIISPGVILNLLGGPR